MTLLLPIKSAGEAVSRAAQALEMRLVRDDDDVILDGFERVVQLDRYSCGAQVTHAVLKFFGRCRSITRTTTLLGTDTDGTAWTAMRRLFNARGLRTRVVDGARKRDLKAALDAGSPCVVSVDDEEHWAVVFGYGDKHVFVADPSFPRSPRVVVPWKTFMRRWDRWAGVVSRLKRRR